MSENLTNSPADYIGEDGLLYCGNCHTPKEDYYPPGFLISGKHFVMCKCREKESDEEQRRIKERDRQCHVDQLRRTCFHAPTMHSWTFKNAGEETAQIRLAKSYVENWKEMKANNAGFLFWGDVGTGKSYTAACIANALIDQEVSVRMTSFPEILNGVFECDNKNDYIFDLNRYELLILDDVGIERASEWSLAVISSVISLRVDAARPLIITTNRSLKEMHAARDMEHRRIYDRILAVCTPVSFSGKSYRVNEGKEHMELIRSLIG